MLTAEQQVKINELKRLNLPVVWIEIAELVGPEIFIKIWQIASTPENQDRNALYVPSFNKYVDFQKTQLIKQFIEAKQTDKQIIENLSKHGLKTTRHTIKRICQRFNLNHANN